MEDVQGHQLNLPIDPNDAGVVVADRADGSRDMGAVAVDIHWIVTGRSRCRVKVPANDIVDKSVGIIVNAIIWDFSGVGPDIVGEIDVVIIDPRVHHRDHHIVSPSLNSGFRPTD